jgi:hypothetical protein
MSFETTPLSSRSDAHSSWETGSTTKPTSSQKNRSFSRLKCSRFVAASGGADGADATGPPPSRILAALGDPQGKIVARDGRRTSMVGHW